MESTEELITALNACSRTKGHRCSECLLLGRYDYRVCAKIVMRKAANQIERLQSQLAEEASRRYQAECNYDAWKKQALEAQRRERAAVEDMAVMALAMRESAEMPEGCCFACTYDAQNLPDNVMLAYGECPGYDKNDCFEWRGPGAGEGATE